MEFLSILAKAKQVTPPFFFAGQWVHLSLTPPVSLLMENLAPNEAVSVQPSPPPPPPQIHDFLLLSLTSGVDANWPNRHHL